MTTAASIRAGRAVVELVGDNKQLKKVLAESSRDAESFGKKIKGLGASFAGLAAGVVSVGALAMKFKQLDDLLDTSSKIGVAVDQLQELHHAAERTGSSLESMNKALPKMAKFVSEAAQGSKSAVEAFAELQLDPSKLIGMSTGGMFREIADAMSKVSSEADQTRLAMEIFGKGGADLLDTIRLGKVGLEGMAGEARQLGKVLGREQIDALQKSTAAYERLSAAMDGLLNNIVAGLSKLAPFIEAATDAIALANRGNPAAIDVPGNAADIREQRDRKQREYDNLRELNKSMLAELNKINPWTSPVQNLLMGMEVDKLHTQLFQLKADLDALNAAWNAMPDAVKKVHLEVAALSPVAQGIVGGVKSAGTLFGRIGEDIGGSLMRTASQWSSMTGWRDKLFPDAAKNNRERAAAEQKADDAALDAVIDEAAAIFDEVRTPAEKFNDTLERLNQLFEEGFLDQETFDRASLRAMDEMADVAGDPKFIDKLADAAVAGTSDAANAILAHQFGPGAENVEERQLAEQRITNRELRRMNQAQRDRIELGLSALSPGRFGG